jgi:peptidase M28-like protein
MIQRMDVHRPRRLVVLLVAVTFAAPGCGGGDDEPGAPPTGRFDAMRAFADLRTQVEIGPRPAGSAESEREARFIALALRRAGLANVRMQHPRLNVLATIPGAEPGAVVVGAHHDTLDAPGFVGANDGASEVALLLELARGLPDRLDGPSIHLVFFDAEEARPGRTFEEDGTRGSRQYVSYARADGKQGSVPLDDIHAMVLFDMVGDCDLQVPLEANSDPDIYDRFAEVDPDTFTGISGGILDDPIPFLEAGVPAVDLIDFDYGPGPSPGAWWHTRQDNLTHVCAKSLDRVGEAAMVALPEIR